MAHHTPSWSTSFMNTTRKRLYGLFTTLAGEQERRITAYVKSTGTSKMEVLRQLKVREQALNSDLPDGVDYVPVPCSEQLLVSPKALIETSPN